MAKPKEPLIMKLGIIPTTKKGVLTNPAWVRPFLRTIEAAGLESVWTVEHPIMAEDYEPLYSYSADGSAPWKSDTEMCDPLEWLAFAAAVTETIKLGTGMLLLPLHAPIILAKRVATLDALSNGRVLLGVGMGWQREEYQTIGVPYEERGGRMDDGIDALRALWSQSPSTHHGPFYNFERVHSDPKPVNGGAVPIIIGGSTGLAARRAGRIGDGFFPHAISPDDFAARVETMRAAAVAAGRDPDAIELTLSPSSWKPEVWGDPAALKAYVDSGVTRFVISAAEAGGNEIGEIERFVMRRRDVVMGLA
jgi:probable F420-dependent oxidoreductase